jgi:ribosomal protein L40E
MATTVEYGACAQCETQNPKSLTTCRQCGAPLPWTKESKSASSSSSSLDLSILVPILGGLIFCVGVFLWFGNVLGFYRTLSGAGYITAAVGAVIFKLGFRD